MGTNIEIRFYGDYDIIKTLCVMTHSEKLDVKVLMGEFCLEWGIDSHDELKEDMMDIFIDYLKGKGFRELSTHTVTFGD